MPDNGKHKKSFSTAYKFAKRILAWLTPDYDKRKMFPHEEVRWIANKIAKENGMELSSMYQVREPDPDQRVVYERFLRKRA